MLVAMAVRGKLLFEAVTDITCDEQHGQRGPPLAGDLSQLPPIQAIGQQH